MILTSTHSSGEQPEKIEVCVCSKYRNYTIVSGRSQAFQTWGEVGALKKPLFSLREKMTLVEKDPNTIMG